MGAFYIVVADRRDSQTQQGGPLRQPRLTGLRSPKALFPRSLLARAAFPHRSGDCCRHHRNVGVVLVSTFSRSNREVRDAMNRAAISLLFIFSSSAVYALTPNQWQFRQTIEVQAPGLVQVDLSAETINIARPDLSDVRIVDAGEKELPFLIDHPMPRAESTVRPKDFHGEIISAETRLLITTGTDLAIAGITLETPAGTNFTKSVRVEGSNDQKNWRTLTSGDPVFSMGNGAASLRGQFPEGKCQFMRVVADDNRTEPLPWTGARLIIAGSPAPTEPVAVTINSRDESPGTTG